MIKQLQTPLLASALVSLGLPQLTAAQEVAFNPMELQIPSDAVGIVQTPTGDSTFGPVPTQVQVRSSIEQQTVRLTFGSEISTWNDFGESSYSLTLSAPFSKSEGRGNLITQTGLPDAYSAEASFRLSLIAPSFTSSELAASAEAEMALATSYAELFGRALTACESSGQESADCRGRDLHSLITASDDPTLQGELAALEERAYAALADQQYLAVQVSGAVGREAFDYRDPISLTLIDRDETVFSASASLTWTPNIVEPFTYVTGFEMERDYKLPDAEIRCPADAGGNANVTCFNASFGAPERETEATIFGAVRYSRLSEELPLGAEFRVALNPENGEWGAELPIYFLTDGDNNLNGGVRLAYDSEEDDVFVGLFIGTTFQ